MDENNSFDKRKSERKSLQLPAEYIWNGISSPCHVVDISMEGIGIRVRGTLIVGDEITVKLERFELAVMIVRVDGNIAGGRLNALSPEVYNMILSIKGY